MPIQFRVDGRLLLLISILLVPVNPLVAMPQENNLRTLLWFDGSDPLANGGNILDGTVLQEWRDKSGNELHAFAANDDNAPVFQSQVGNQAGGIRFNGGQQAMTSNFNPSWAFNNETGITSFVVFSYNQATNGQFVWASDAEASPRQYLGVESDLDGNVSIWTQTGAGQAFQSDPAPRTGNMLVSVGSGFGNGLFQVNGVDQSSSSSIGNTTPVSSSFHLGNVRSNGGDVANSGLSGGIAEVVMFNSSLTQNQLADVNSYLSQKWGVSTPSNNGDAGRGRDLVSSSAVAAPQPAIRNPVPEVPASKKLVVVTHGWAGLTFDPDDEKTLAWVDSMRDAIRSEIDARFPDEKEDWRVVSYDWTQSSGKSRNSNTGPLRPNRAFDNASEHGRELGAVIGESDFEHVHFIGYSAGAGLLHEAATAIKEKAVELGEDAPDVHLTFLDGFIPFGRNSSDFATDADWSDNLFTRDSVPLTSNVLENAHNVDLTAVAPDPIHFSSVEFYKHSIDGKIFRESVSPELRERFDEVDTSLFANALVGNTNVKYGFGLSSEAGRWFEDLPSELKAELENNPDNVVDFSGEPRGGIDYFEPSRVDYTIASTTDSLTGDVRVEDGIVSLVTASPAWTILKLDVHSQFDMLALQMDFGHEENSEGLLAIYLNDVLLGAIDERFDIFGSREYFFSMDELQLSGQNSLSLRLDGFSDVSSSALISDIRLFTTAIPEPSSTLVMLYLVLSQLSRRRRLDMPSE